MARFFARIQGARGPATRLGTPKSGISASVQGWETGVLTTAGAAGDADRLVVNLTRGTRGGGFKPIACITEAPNGGPECTTMVLYHPITGEVLYSGPAWKKGE